MISLSTFSAIIFIQFNVIFIILFVIWYIKNGKSKTKLKTAISINGQLKKEYDELKKEYDKSKLENEDKTKSLNELLKQNKLLNETISEQESKLDTSSNEVDITKEQIPELDSELKPDSEVDLDIDIDIDIDIDSIIDSDLDTNQIKED